MEQLTAILITAKNDDKYAGAILCNTETNACMVGLGMQRNGQRYTMICDEEP